MSQDRSSQLLYSISLLGIILGLAATLYFFAGMSGHIRNPVLNMATAGVLILAAGFFLYIFFTLLPDKNRLGSLIWLLILLVLSIEVVLSLVPPTARDELTHHLAMPRLYVNAGQIIEVPFALHSYYPMLLDMLYTPFVQWGWDSIPKFIHGLYGFLTALLLYAYLARRLSPVYGLLGFFFLISTPVMLRLSHVAYVDLGLLFYFTASLLCLLRWIEGKEATRWLILGGLSAGFALATKPNGFLVFFLLFFLLGFVAGGERERGLWEKISWLLLFSVLTFVSFSPWVFKNLVQTGNPFFPFFGEFFRSGSGEGGGVSVSRGVGLGIFTTRAVHYGESWWQIVALPLRVFFSGRDDDPQYFDGVLSPMLILFLPWAFKGRWIQEKRLLFAFAFLYFFYAFFLVEMRIRYVLPIVPPLVILLVYGVHNIYLRITRPIVLFAIVFSLLVLNGAYLWRYFHQVSPLAYILGRENRDAYLTRMLPDYPAFRYINRDLPPTARVYFVLMGKRGYYCERNYFYEGGNPAMLLRITQGSRSGNEIGAKFQQQGLTHLLVREDLLSRFLTHNLTPKQWDVWNVFVQFHLRRLFRANGYSVYKIYGS